MNPTDALVAYNTPVHSIHVIGFARIPTTGAAMAAVCFHRKRRLPWYRRWFQSEYQHMHLCVVKHLNLTSWQLNGEVLNEADGIIPRDVQERLNLEFAQSEKDCPMPGPLIMAQSLAFIVSQGWGSLEVSEFADLLLADTHIGPALRAYSKGAK